MPKYAIGFDLASSVKKTADYTTYVRLCLTDNNIIVIEDYYRAQLNTAEVEKLILKVAKDNPGCKLVLPLDSAQAGKAQQMYLTRALQGYWFEFIPQTQSKLERAKPISSQVMAGNVRIVKRKDYIAFCNELNDFTDDEDEYLHDDYIDALSIGYNSLLKPSAKFNDINLIQPPRLFAEKDNSEDLWADKKGKESLKVGEDITHLYSRIPSPMDD